MRTLVDQLRDKLGSGVVVLGSATQRQCLAYRGVTKDLTSRIQAGKVIGPVAQKVGGKGGGGPIWPRPAAKIPAALDAALGDVYGVVEGVAGKLRSVFRYQFPVLSRRADEKSYSFHQPQGKKILLVDCTNCTVEQLVELAALVPARSLRSLTAQCFCWRILPARRLIGRAWIA